MKNLKSEVINLKDEIMKLKAAEDRELGKQLEGRMKNAPIPNNNRNKSRENDLGPLGYGPSMLPLRNN